jgi:hypothetical protein
MDKMEEFTHPVELSDEELDLVAAAGGDCGCPLIDVDVTVVIVLN